LDIYFLLQVPEWTRAAINAAVPPNKFADYVQSDVRIDYFLVGTAEY
jgi:hypothetical protein